MYRIGLTGGIGSGKSAAAAILAEFGAHLVVADEIAREQVRPGSAVLEELVSEFGSGILNADGTLDRRLLGEVFGDPAKLERLNAITHPPLVEAILERMERFEQGDPEGVVVLDAALLVDWDLADAVDLVVAVSAPEDVRVARLEAGGLREEAARSRMSVQLTDEGFAEVADEIVDNAGTLEELRTRVSEIWKRVESARGEGAQ